jgi:hypothetical protein
LSAKLALQLHRIPLGDRGFGSHDSINLTCPLNLTKKLGLKPRPYRTALINCLPYKRLVT